MRQAGDRFTFNGFEHATQNHSLNSLHGAASHTWIEREKEGERTDSIDKQHPNYTLLQPVTECIQLKLISPSMADNQSDVSEDDPIL